MVEFFSVEHFLYQNIFELVNHLKRGDVNKLITSKEEVLIIPEQKEWDDRQKLRNISYLKRPSN